jgi:hypothetical protein
MVGRTPEYVGKKIQADEVKMTMLALLCIPGTILLLTSVASTISPGLAGIANPGPHGFSEILYAYTSAAATNGSAFAGLNANTPFYNLTFALPALPSFAFGSSARNSGPSSSISAFIVARSTAAIASGAPSMGLFVTVK